MNAPPKKSAAPDSFRAYRWLVTIAEPNPKLYGFLRDNGVDLNHVLNLLEGAINVSMVMPRSLVVR